MCQEKIISQKEDFFKIGDKTISLTKLLEVFTEEYEKLYDGPRPWDYNAAISGGDTIITEYSELTRAFAAKRQDVLSSDREVAAFWYALHNQKMSKLRKRMGRSKLGTPRRSWWR